jgi:acetyl esterase/lipase
MTRSGTLAGACIGIVIAVTGCAQSPVPAASAPPTETVSLAPLPENGCSDDQDGRYVTELFASGPVSTASFTGGLETDIYQPADDPAKCRVGVVWVHGGGFTQATRNGPAEQSWGATLAKRGFVVMSIDYRLGSGEPFGLDQATDPSRAEVVANAVADTTAAIQWVRANANEFRVDPKRLVVGGTSAGAMTAVGAALTSPAVDRPCAVVSVSGDLDPTWVGSDPAPALFVHGDADVVVPYQSSVDAVQTLIAEGGQAQLVTIDGSGHEITGVPSQYMIDEVSRWLRGSVAAGCS